MALHKKFEHEHEAILRDIRPFFVRVGDTLRSRSVSTATYVLAAGSILLSDLLGGWPVVLADLILIFAGIYFFWLITRDRSIAFKLPMGAPYKDSHNDGPGRNKKAEGILYLGNIDDTNEEVWFTNSDARTHILYLGTTGAGKTVGLTSMVTNALAWASGFVYVDGKADTDLWSNLSALCRRFGRDDDLLVLNYMTGNSDVQAPSNTMNPFSSGSASYLVNMLVELMPESEGDNAMWKERAVSLVSAMMPILTWKRDNQDIPMSVRSIRENLSLGNVVKLARDSAVPDKYRAGLMGYLDTLPGFAHEAYDDNGQIKPPDGGGPPPDTTTANQQHGYLAMQFTRALQSLGDDYGYIFDTQAADVDMVDIVLNRRVLIVLIPALEKSGDEIANLGKIVASTMKGMMGSALGSTVEGEASKVIENKPTHSSTPFMTVFDEVGYYTAAGMAVMAAQARSLGFSLVFSGQDLPALKKRVREEANSITANCNIKLFGKLEDPTETKEFFEKTVGSAMVTEVSGYQMAGGGSFGSYQDTQQASVQVRARAGYEGLRGFTEGQAIVTFGEAVTECRIFYSNPGHAKAMRVTRFVALPAPDEQVIKHADAITKLRDLMVNKNWTAERAEVAIETADEIKALAEGFKIGEHAENKSEAGITALIAVHGLKEKIAELPPKAKKAVTTEDKPDTATPPAPPPQPQEDTSPETPAQQTSAESSTSTDKAPPPVFSAPKTQEQGAQAAPLTPPPAQDPPAEKPAQAASESGDGGDGGGAANPMGFFSTPGAATPPPEDTASDGGDGSVASPEQSPVTPPQKTTAAAVKTGTTPVQTRPPVTLPAEIETIINKAAKQAREALFKEGRKDG